MSNKCFYKVAEFKIECKDLSDGKCPHFYVDWIGDKVRIGGASSKINLRVIKDTLINNQCTHVKLKIKDKWSSHLKFVHDVSSQGDKPEDQNNIFISVIPDNTITTSTQFVTDIIAYKEEEWTPELAITKLCDNTCQEGSTCHNMRLKYCSDKVTGLTNECYEFCKEAKNLQHCTKIVASLCTASNMEQRICKYVMSHRSVWGKLDAQMERNCNMITYGPGFEHCACMNTKKIKEHVNGIPENYANQFLERPNCYYVECSRQSAYKSAAMIDQECPVMKVCKKDIKNFNSSKFPRHVSKSIEFVDDSDCTSPQSKNDSNSSQGKTDSNTAQASSNPNPEQASTSPNPVQASSDQSKTDNNKNSYMTWLGGGGVISCMLCYCCIAVIFVFMMMRSSS